MGIVLVIIAYLLGSISFGYLVARFVYKEDVRTLGSGNPGATNVMRLYGFQAGLAVLFLDVLKGFLVITLSRFMGVNSSFLVLSGLAVVIGHNWPVYFSFKGGKGAATTLGVFFAIDPLLTLLVFAGVIIVILLSKYVSLGSILGGISIPLVLFWAGYGKEYIIFGFLLTLLIIWRHRTNLKRLLQGTERKMGAFIFKGKV